MPSKKRKYNARFPTGRIKKIMRIDVDIGKVALPVPVMISRALELFVSSLLNKAGNITLQKNARTLTLTHLKQCIYSDSRLDFLKELVKNTPELCEESNDNNSAEPPVTKRMITTYDSDDEPSTVYDRSSSRMTETIISYLLTSGCLCELPNDVYSNLFSIERRTLETFTYLNEVRLLLSTYRRQVASANCCQTVDRACSELLSHASWFDYLLEQLTTTELNRYIMYSASCVAFEAALCCDQRHLTNFIDGLMLAVIEPGLDRPPSVAALAVLERVLNNITDHDDYSGKTLLLNQLHKRWAEIKRSVVKYANNPMSDGRTSMLLDLISFWKSLFLAQSAEAILPYFYLELSGMYYHLYRADTDQRVWLGTVRLFGASMHLRSLVVPPPFMQDFAESIVKNVSRLLYSMRKIINGSNLEINRNIVLQETMLLTLRSLRVLAITPHMMLVYRGDNIDLSQVPEIMDAVHRLDSYVKSSEIYEPDVKFIRWVVRMMYDRDDVIIEVLMGTLDVFFSKPRLRVLFDPFIAFSEFLACLLFNHDVLLDYLISDENDFLVYVMSILKVACVHISTFCESCSDTLTDIVDLLTRLRVTIMQLNRNNNFPYNSVPLANVIQRFIELVSQVTTPTNL